MFDIGVDKVNEKQHNQTDRHPITICRSIEWN